jgi:hypothetical protein
MEEEEQQQQFKQITHQEREKGKITSKYEVFKSRNDHGIKYRSYVVPLQLITTSLNTI